MTSVSAFQCQWVPFEWADEICPPPLGSPDDFICKRADGTYWIVVDGDVNALEDPNQDWKQQIEPGQVISFLSHEFYGEFTVTIEEDGSFSTDRPYPEKANGFITSDEHDDIYESLDSYVKEHPSGDYDVSIYWWSVGETPFRFELDHEGKPHFVSCHGTS